MRGRLLRRYNRFLVDIETESGGCITAFCPATGRLRSCYRVGAPVEYRPVSGASRRTDYDWWSIRMSRTWVIIDTRPAPDVLKKQHASLSLPEDWQEGRWSTEPVLEDGSRLDIRIGQAPVTTFVEVKSVTWCRKRVGLFPDAPSERASRHVRTLMEIARQDSRDAAMILVSMRSDIDVIEPAHWIDPEFSDLLREAKQSGVEIVGLASSVSCNRIELKKRIPVRV